MTGLTSAKLQSAMSTSVTNLRGEALDRHELQDTAAMFMDIRQQALRTACRHRRATLRNDSASLPAIKRDARTEVGIVQNAWRAWQAAGGWHTYYQVEATGATHSLMACHTINAHTGLRLNQALTGRHPQDVANLGYNLCKHCLRRTPAEAHRAAQKMVDRFTALLLHCC